MSTTAQATNSATKTQIRHKLSGWRPSLPSLKHPKYRLSFAQTAPLPSKVDLRSVDAPIFDQAQENSCSGNAAADLVDFLQLKALTEKLVNAPELLGPTFVPASRQFIYWNGRNNEDVATQDDGVSDLADILKGIAQVGVCREVTWPYTENDVDQRPSPAAFAEGALHKLPNYYSLDTDEDVKLCLSHGYPSILGIAVFESFMSDDVAANGLVPMPTQNDPQKGGHAIVRVGYDDSQGLWICRNSWGTSWGDNGYFYLPYEYTASGLADDYFTLRPAGQSV